LRISDVPVEFLTWSVNVSTVALGLKASKAAGKKAKAVSSGKRNVFDPASGKSQAVPTYLRNDLAPGMRLGGPALVVEPQTTTLVPRGWSCAVSAAGDLFLERKT
jgi:N-methylhydantoinase A